MPLPNASGKQHQGHNGVYIHLPDEYIDNSRSFQTEELSLGVVWRLGSESNRRPRLCRPLHNHSATQPKRTNFGAGNRTRTCNPNLRKVSLPDPGAAILVF